LGPPSGEDVVAGWAGLLTELDLEAGGHQRPRRLEAEGHVTGGGDREGAMAGGVQDRRWPCCARLADAFGHPDDGRWRHAGVEPEMPRARLDGRDGHCPVADGVKLQAGWPYRPAQLEPLPQ